jgi:uncharacterized membrane protein
VTIKPSSEPPTRQLSIRYLMRMLGSEPSSEPESDPSPGQAAPESSPVPGEPGQTVAEPDLAAAEPARLAESGGLSGPAAPAEAAGPSGPAGLAGLSGPAAPAEAAGPSGPAGPAEAAGLAGPTRPGRPAEPDPLEAAEPAEPPTRQLSVRYLQRMLGSAPTAPARPVRARPAPTVRARPAPTPLARRLEVLLIDPWYRRCLLALALLAILAQMSAAWAAQVVLVPALLVLPGLLLLRALRVSGSAVAAFPAYVPCASIVVLLASGLIVDLVGPLVGVARPLSPEPMLAGLELSGLSLLAAGARAGPEVAIPWAVLARPARLAWPLALPVLAAAGALRLNNGHGGAVALLAVIACVAAIICALVFASRLDTAQLTVLIYAAALALMWGFSLRGDLVYGFDIAAEYHALQQTLQAGVWHTAHVGDAYGALLSVTVLPAEVHAVSGLSGLLVFKVVYPAIGALLPVIVFSLARRMIGTGWAFAAAAVIVGQQTFFQELPGLARQEISLVLFAALVMAVLDANLARWSRLPLVALLGLAMAVSHYSTTYFAIVMFALALPLQWGISWLRRAPRVSASLVTAVIAATVGAATWYWLVTRSASNMSQFVSAVGGQGLELLPNAGSLIAKYLQAGSTVGVSASEYARQVHLYYATHVPYVHPNANASLPVYALRNSNGPSTPVSFALGLSVLGKSQLLIVQLMNLIAAIGALALVLSRKSSLLHRQIGLLGLATLVILAVIRFSGTAATAYNPERAFLQALPVLGIGMCWALQWLAGTAGRRQIAVLAVTAAALLVLFANTTSLAGAVFGGGTDTNLANSGGDYDQFDMSTAELQAASWLVSQAPANQLVYADRYAELRLIAVAGQRSGMLSDVTPLTLSQYAWVYADRANVTQGVGLAYFNGESASYVFPFRYLNADYDLVYTNGTSEVFVG